MEKFKIVLSIRARRTGYIAGRPVFYDPISLFGQEWVVVDFDGSEWMRGRPDNISRRLGSPYISLF